MIPVLSLQAALDTEGDSRAILLSASQQYVLMMLADKLSENPASFYSDYKDHDPLDITDFNDTLLNAVMEEQLITPLWIFRSQRIFGDQFGVTSGGSEIWVSLTSSFFAGYWTQTPGAINDSREAEFTCTSGEYRIFFGVHKNNNCAIMTIKIDGSSIGTIDLYNATLQLNQHLQSASFDITEDSTHTLEIAALSKNASSSSYVIPIVYADVVRLADL